MTQAFASATILIAALLPMILLTPAMKPAPLRAKKISAANKLPMAAR